ncbi:MAG TPA: FixH family protein [Lysobacter sp.]
MDKTPLWKMPVMWLVVGLPLLSIVAGVGLVVVASRTSNDAVPDHVRRTAQIQVADLGPDAVAQRERLGAVVRVQDGRIDVFPVGDRFQRDVPLRLTLLHPSRAADDATVDLRPAETGWQADVTIDRSHDWNLQLAPADGRWRLLGRLERGAEAVHVHPALQGAP